MIDILLFQWRPSFSNTNPLLTFFLWWRCSFLRCKHLSFNVGTLSFHDWHSFFYTKKTSFRLIVLFDAKASSSMWTTFLQWLKFFLRWEGLLSSKQISFSSMIDILLSSHDWQLLVDDWPFFLRCKHISFND